MSKVFYGFAVALVALLVLAVMPVSAEVTQSVFATQTGNYNQQSITNTNDLSSGVTQEAQGYQTSLYVDTPAVQNVQSISNTNTVSTGTNQYAVGTQNGANTQTLSNNNAYSNIGTQFVYGQQGTPTEGLSSLGNQQTLTNINSNDGGIAVYQGIAATQDGTTNSQTVANYNYGVSSNDPVTQLVGQGFLTGQTITFTPGAIQNGLGNNQVIINNN